ncbi:MAG: 2-hydroxychromene-2-carboxylate isomerase [Pseudomonadota bacterium]
MARIDYYLSLISPFTYLAGMRLEEVAQWTGAEIVYRPMDILTLFGATGGVPVPQRHPSRQAYRLQELRRGSAAAGLPLTAKPAHWPTDVGLASAAVMVAADRGAEAGRLAHGLLAACWAEEKDIADPAVVAEKLAEVGLDMAAMDAEIEAARPRLAENTEAAIAAGVFGAPFYVVGEELFWGSDRLEALEAHLRG